MFCVYSNVDSTYAVNRGAYTSGGIHDISFCYFFVNFLSLKYKLVIYQINQ